MAINNQHAFFELVRAGLWEKEAQLSQFGSIDYAEIYNLAEQQSVVGIVAAGLEHVQDVKIPQNIALKFVGNALQLEQRNLAMNDFVAKLIERLRNKNINPILLKGQGIAQCYNRPSWRTCGDIDLLFSNTHYEDAKRELMPLATSFDTEEKCGKHIGLLLNSWKVELHGTQHSELSVRIDKVIDETQEDIFYGGKVRSWQNGKVKVFLPAPDCDVVFIFTHFIKHYFKEGVGLRQLCDWCRLLWTYRNIVDTGLLERSLGKMKLMTEWKAFATFVVKYLGMPQDAIPMYSEDKRWDVKANQICDYIIEVGNFGQNRDMSYFSKYPYLFRKVISFVRRSCYLIRHAKVFPWDSIRFFPSLLFFGVRSAVRGE